MNAVAVEYQYSLLDLKKGDSILNIAPPFVAFGACLAIHAPLCRGLRVCLCPSPAPELSAKTYQRYRPTHYLGGPANLKDIVSKLEGKKLDLSHISTVACGGEQIHKEDADEYVEFFRKKGAHITHLIPGYGMTEFGGTVVTSGDHAYKDGSVGIPFALANIKIVDLENGMELGFDKEGEIWMTSPSLMKGYFGGIEKDAIVEDENGVRWMKTGDLGKVDRDGFVYLVGRIKRIYLVKGTDDGSVYKLFPDYIENVLRSDDTVDKAAVIVEKRGDANYVPIAYIETKSGQKPDVDRLMDFCKEKLPLYMVPVQIIHTDKIPVTVSGKIDYRKLEEMNQGEI